MAILAGKLEARRPGCAPLAGKSTLNRLEHAPAGEPTRYHRIGHDAAAIERLFIELFLDAHRKPAAQIVLDLDATDDPLHGHQEGRFFHGYYDCGAICRSTCSAVGTCSWPSSGARTSTLPPVRSRRSSASSLIRGRWRRVKILLRADSGFARDALMTWCERNRVDYVFGHARNARLEAEIAPELARAEAVSRTTGTPARVFKDFPWTTLDSWSRKRRVVAKAEWTQGGPNPRFIVTSLSAAACDASGLYEDLYCARGEMENRIKECHSGSRRSASAATMKANQLRLWFASMAYVLLCALRQIGLATPSSPRPPAARSASAS